MKKILIASVISFLLLSTFAFTNRYVDVKLPDPVFKLMEVTYLFPLLYGDNYGYTSSNTQVTSLWTSYYMVKRYASIKIMEETFGEKVFVSGPHQDDMNWTNVDDFGHYNPDFLNQLYSTVEEVLDNDMFKEVAEQVYDEYYANLMKVFGEAYDYLEEDPEMKQKAVESYRQHINQENPGQLQYDLDDKFQEENPNLDREEASMAFHFWLRRSIDGTEDEFVKLFKLIYDKIG